MTFKERIDAIQGAITGWVETVKDQQKLNTLLRLEVEQLHQDVEVLFNAHPELNNEANRGRNDDA